MQANQYDYIFLGAGCASLSIIMRMVDSNKFSDKKILLIDKQPKTKNDRTWCFWEATSGFFEDLVHHKWDKLFFNTDAENICLEMGNYQYKMIRGIDFYNKCFGVLHQQKNIDVVYGEIGFEEQSNKIQFNNEFLEVDTETIVFNSIYSPSSKQKNKFYLIQHFKGWIIETVEEIFTPHQAILMDFRVNQNEGTTFVYVLPLSSTKALIEYTLFGEQVLSKEIYDQQLKNYLKEFLSIENYTIIEEEFGIIPMTNADFSFFKNGMYYIGTAGGQTKASTGYTFRFIQKQADKIVSQLISKGAISKNLKAKKRVLFYDSTLLHILYKKLLKGKTIFSILFKKNRADIIFKFLDNETTILEEIKLLNSLPKKIFIKAGFSEFLKISSGW
jgi:lycopene beta-cyclase